MNLNLIALPGEATNIALTHIEGRIQVPHVPLKFNSEQDNLELLAIIQDPRVYLESLADTSDALGSIATYIDVTKKSIDANYIYKAEDIVRDTNAFILDLFDRLNLSEENYKTKTGSESLRNDVENKKIDVVEHHIPSLTVLDPDDYDLQESWFVYNDALAKSFSV